MPTPEIPATVSEATIDAKARLLLQCIESCIGVALTDKSRRDILLQIKSLWPSTIPGEAQATREGEKGMQTRADLCKQLLSMRDEAVEWSDYAAAMILRDAADEIKALNAMTQPPEGKTEKQA